MQHLLRGKYLLAMLFSLLLLTSCGGGGGTTAPATAAGTTLAWDQGNWGQVNWQ